MKRCFFYRLPWLLTLFAPAVAAPAQNPAQAENPAIPVVTFNCLWEAATPQEYTITLRSTGGARYVSSNPVRASEDRTQEPDYEIEFTMSAANRDKVFRLAQQAGYFNGNFDYKKHAMANTGKKTLTYADISRHYQTTYNWSENTAIDQLTELFTGISNTIEHGRKLEFLHRFDKLGLEAELKGMEDAAQNHYLAELPMIAPVLESIANDPSVLNIARQRARRLLAQSKQEAEVR
jgi:hypothetical protein